MRLNQTFVFIEISSLGIDDWIVTREKNLASRARHFVIQLRSNQAGWWMFERKQSVLGRKMMESGLSCLQFTHSNRLDLNEGFFLQSRSECPPGLQSRSTMLKAVFYKHHPFRWSCCWSGPSIRSREGRWMPGHLVGRAFPRLITFRFLQRFQWVVNSLISAFN